MTLLPNRIAAFVALACLTAPITARAQTPAPVATGPYVLAGGGWEIKSFGAQTCGGSSAGCVDDRVRVPALMLGAGIPVARHVSLEVTAEWPSRPTVGEINWRWSYSAPVTNNTASHRDVPVLLLARWQSRCERACLEPVAGAGIAIHEVSNRVLSECGSVGVPLPCTTPSSSTRTPGTEDDSRLRFAWGAGLDLRVRVANRIWLQPSVRFTWIADGNELWPDNFRGPNTGSPIVGTFGLAIMVR